MIILKKLIFLPLFLLLVGLLVYFYKNHNVCPKTGCFSMQNLDKFKTAEIYQNDQNIYRAMLKNGDDILRLEVKSGILQDEAQKEIATRIARMQALFENATSPYPGEITNVIECTEKFKPTLTKVNQINTEIAYFTGYLNNRLTFGSCTEDQAIYKGNLIFFYCAKEKQLIQLELITPKEKFLASETEYGQILSSLGCKD